jgi:hypothetical protein
MSLGYENEKQETKQISEKNPKTPKIEMLVKKYIILMKK